MVRLTVWPASHPRCGPHPLATYRSLHIVMRGAVPSSHIACVDHVMFQSHEYTAMLNGSKDVFASLLAAIKSHVVGLRILAAAAHDERTVI
jgi:hypothetical protein